MKQQGRELEKTSKKLDEVWQSLGGKPKQMELRDSRGEGKKTEPDFKLTSPPNQTFESMPDEQGELNFPDERQGKLKLRPTTGIRKADLEEMFEGIKDFKSYDPQVDHKFAKDELSYYSKGKPGLEVLAHTSGSSFYKSHDIIFRNAEGKPIGVATTEKLGDGPYKVDTLAVDKDAGLARGPAVLAIIKKLAELKALVPQGSYSKHTANLVKTLSAYLDDVESSDEDTEDRNDRRKVRQNNIRRQKLRDKDIPTP